jgi:endo-1,4-beta-xylanase
MCERIGHMVIPPDRRWPIAACLLVVATPAGAQTRAALPPLPAPLSIPSPAPVTDAPYAPQAIVPGGIVVPLYPPGSPKLKADRVREAETYSLSQAVPGRISSIVNIHNPSIEIHPVERGINTGAVVILAAGGGHNTLNVGTESADFVPFFYNYGVNTVILRNRLRRDGYDVAADANADAQQAIRLVRAYAPQLGFDPKKIGIMGFSAGAELSSATAVLYEAYDAAHADPADPLAGVSSRPDFVGIIYPGPTPFARNRVAPPIPKDVPPAFIASGASGDRGHAIWAMDYFAAMLPLGVPNIEMHLYGNGRHPGDPLPDGSRQSGGLTDRNDIPLGTWQARFVDWFRDLGFLQKPGVETKAARDVAAFVANPPRPAGQGPAAGPPVPRR